MDIISEHGAFLVLLLFGAFFVAVHAYRLYGEVRQEDIDEDIVWMEGKVQLIDFVGRRSYATGFLCYLALLELMFLVLSSSSVILDMALTAVGNSRSVGALGSSGTAINPWAPVLASSAVIAITEVKPFMQIEHAIRRVAHHIAGIPRHLKSTIDRVYDEVPDVAALQDLGADGTAAERTGADGDEETRLKTSVERLRSDVLRLNGWARDCFGSAHRYGSLHGVQGRIRDEIDVFEREYRQLVAVPESSAGEPALERPSGRAVFGRALEVKRRLVFYLALVIVRSEVATLPRNTDGQLGKLVASAHGGKRSASLFNTLALSTVSGFALALGAVFLGYLTVYVLADFTEENVSVFPARDTVLIRSYEMSDYIFVTLNKALSSALWDVAALGSIFLTASLVAVGVMLPKFDRGEWRAWRERESVIQYLTTGALAVMVTYPLYLTFLSLKLVVVPSVRAGDMQRVVGLMNDFGSSFLGYSLIGLMAFPCAVVVCRLFDDYLSHDPSRVGEGDRKGTPTVDASDRRLSPGRRIVLVFLAALLCGLVNLVLLLRMSVLTDSSDALGAALLPALVILCFLGACARYTVAPDKRAAGHDAPKVRGNAKPSDEIQERKAAKPPDTMAAGEGIENESGARPRGERGTGSAAALSVSICVLFPLVASIPLVLTPRTASGDNGAEAIGCERNASGDFDLDDCRIIVGVRGDARPFSYLSNTPPEEDILPGFGGYMIEICRRVLREMTSAGPFESIPIVPAMIEAKDRFPSLQYGDIDMLCGPDSITIDRLDQYYVSHPVFLSGMTYGYVDPRSPKFPRSAYCENVVGVVRGTTAESVGLDALDESGLLLRFDDALALDLKKEARQMKYAREALVYSMRFSKCYEEDLWDEDSTKLLSRDALDRVVESTLNEKKRGHVWEVHADEFNTINRAIAREVVTAECPAGFSGLPVRRFNNHDKGIRDFCEGKVLYYLGDYDILTRRIREFSDCEVKMNRFTTSRELYGVFFAARGRASAFEEVRDFVRDECKADYETVDRQREERIRPKRALLYAEFNTALLRMMQRPTSLLEEAFEAEFGEKAKSKDLVKFFDSLKIAQPGQ